MGDYKDKHGKTRVGNFLQKVAPHILDSVGGFLPDNGALGIVKNIIEKDDKISDIDKAEALNLIEIDLKDMEGARDMYKSTDHKTADDIAKRVINYNLWVVMLAVIIEIFSVMYIDDKVLIAIISGAIGSITTALLQERQQIINFFFGSSRGSKEKDAAKVIYK